MKELIPIRTILEGNYGDNVFKAEYPRQDIWSVVHMSDELLINFYSGHIVCTDEVERYEELNAIAEENARIRRIITDGTEYR